MEELTDDPSGTVKRWVWSGFYSPGVLREMLEEFALDDEGFANPALEALLQEELTKKRVAEASWLGPTDCDRLDRAFAQLNASGVCALQKAGYTKQDGFADVGEAVAQAGPGRFHGFCFYHEQDLERAMDGLPLYLAFDDLKQDDARAVAVGRAIVDVMESHGFTVDWDGTVETRVSLPGLVWRKRSFTSAPSAAKGAAAKPWWRFW